MSRLTARDRRALRLGAWLVAPALAWSLLLRPGLAEVAALRDTLAAERALLQRERAAIARLASPGTGPAPEALARALRPRLFAGRDDVIASAALAAHVGRLAEAHEVRLQSATTRPATRGRGGVRALHVDVQAEGDIGGLVRWLDALERGSRLVQVHTLEVDRRADAGDGTEPLGLRATITGYAEPSVVPAPVERP